MTKRKTKHPECANKNKAKEIILHRNLYSPRAEIESHCTKEDYEIYCYRKHTVCIPDCTDCKFFAGTPSGLEIDCLWEDFKESTEPDGHIVNYCDRYNELERVEKSGLLKRELCTQKNYDDYGFTVEVFIAMDEKQAEKKKTNVCLSPSLPESKRIYHDLKNIPDKFCISKKISWETTICAYKQNAPAIFEILYPEKNDFDFNAILDKIDGDIFYLIGFDK